MTARAVVATVLQSTVNGRVLNDDGLTFPEGAFRAAGAKRRRHHNNRVSEFAAHSAIR